MWRLKDLEMWRLEDLEMRRLGDEDIHKFISPTGLCQKGGNRKKSEA